MATSKSQRAAIWVIAIIMAIGSVGFYFLIIIENNQMAQQQADLQKQMQQAQEEQLKNTKPLPGQKAAAFDAKSVTKLEIKDLKAGKGDAAPKDAKVTVNYMGWTPDGKLFDSSFKGDKPEPIQLQLSAVIQGWKEGIPGMKVGGIRQLTIPADKAYGSEGSTGIPPNTPLKFIVELKSIDK